LKFAVHSSKLAALRSDTDMINGEVLNTGLAVVAALAGRPFKVIDSINQRPYASKSIETTDWIFAPLHLKPARDDNTHHWVLAVIPADTQPHNRRYVKVFDSAPCERHWVEATEILEAIYRNLGLGIEPRVTFTSPIIQENHYSCADMVLATACYIAAEEEVVPEIQYYPWRQIFGQVLGWGHSEERNITISSSYPDFIKALQNLVPR
jgi:hypothetical protein